MLNRESLNHFAAALELNWFIHMGFHNFEEWFWGSQVFQGIGEAKFSKIFRKSENLNLVRYHVANSKCAPARCLSGKALIFQQNFPYDFSCTRGDVTCMPRRSILKPGPKCRSEMNRPE